MASNCVGLDIGSSSIKMLQVKASAKSIQLLDFGIEHDIVRKSGAFFSYGETRLGQGRNNAKQFLAENPEVAGEIEAKVRTALGIGDEVASAETTPEASPIAEARAA